MRILATVRGLWLTLLRRGRAERSLDDEVRAYVDLLAAEYEEAGMAPGLARRRALIETGGIEQVKEATRDAWVGRGIFTFVRDLRFTLRTLRNAPAFSVLAVTILGIGIGGATAIFTVIKGSLLQPLPAVSDAGGLVTLEPVKDGTLRYGFSYLDYRDLREQTRSLAGLIGYDGTSMTLEDRRGPRRSAWVSYVTGDFFSVLGVRAAAGRLIQPADEEAANPVVVLAYDLWQERYGGDPGVIGSTVDVAGYPLTVIGVAPPRFIGAMLLYPMELWIPFTTVPKLVSAPGMLDSRSGRFLRLVGRLAPGTTVDEAQQELSLLAARLADAYPADEGRGIRVFPGAGMTVEERTALGKLPHLLAAAVGLLLLIACANVANLSLVRAAARRRELATRLALGASRRSLFGRLLLEGAVLAAAGALLGIGIARLLVRSQSIVRTIAGMPERVGLDVTLDRRVLIVALAVSALAALAVSIAPVLHVMRVPPGAVLKDGAAGAVRRRSFGQRALVAGQIAASFVLLASAAIVLNTFRRVLATDPGFDARGVAIASADFEEAKLDSAQVMAYRREWLRRAAAEPSIAGVAMASVVPPAPWVRPGWVFRGGEEPPPGARLDGSPAGGRRAYVDVVSPGFFDVMHVPITAGRGFLESDDNGAAPVVIVSRRLAAAMWPKENPIGKMLSLPAAGGRRRPAMRVIGVAGDVRLASIFDEAPPVAYMPVAQHPEEDVDLFVVRSRSGGGALEATIRAIGAAADARVPLHTRVVTEMIDEQLQPQRIASAWIGVFGAVALLLAAIGLYGVVAQGVLQRTRELAVRSALGASPRGVISLVIADGMRIAVIGSVIGVVAGAVALRVLQSRFAGVSVVDAPAAVLAAAAVCVATVAACYLPARRASRIDLLEALRCD
ncbi:MAG TPA: ADOP family duplicated permease [Longimicrobiales bacterium]